MMLFFGLISIVFFDTMYEVMDESLNAYAFIILSIFAVHPYSPVTNTHGDSSILVETTTFSTLSPNTSFISLHNYSNLAFSSSLFFFSSSVSSKSKPSLVHDFNFFPSYSFSYYTIYSSMGSTKYNTSKPFFLKASKKGDYATAALLSPVI